MTALIAPSILSADASNLAEAVRMMEKAGAEMIHIDIMDGHFVPNLTFGPSLVSSLRKITRLTLNVHLMVENPGAFIAPFREAGADWISFHIEATDHVHREIAVIKDGGAKAGVSLNPATPIHFLADIVQELDFILLMTVNPGWGGQDVVPFAKSKIRQLRGWLDRRKLSAAIQIDGGIKGDNLIEFVEAGADILVIGSGIFKSASPEQTLRKMREMIEKAIQR